jgi:predicted phosphoribosyltransferase
MERSAHAFRDRMTAGVALGRAMRKLQQLAQAERRELERRERTYRRDAPPLPADLLAIGYWYRNFDQVGDAEVCALLDRTVAFARATAERPCAGRRASLLEEEVCPAWARRPANPSSKTAVSRMPSWK